MWQPIASAPKDGTRIVLYCASVRDKSEQARVGKCEVDFWHNSKEHDFIGWGKFNATFWPPTHWMPLPILPKVGDLPFGADEKPYINASEIALSEAMHEIALLPAPNEDVMRGHEEAFRAVERLYEAVKKLGEL